MRRKPLRLAVLLLSVLAPAVHAAGKGLTVFAAASLANVLQEAGEAYTAQTQVPVTFSFAASSALARQVEAGAPADAFISADQDWMDYLQSRALVVASTRVNVAGNELVLVAPAASAVALKIAPGFALAAALGDSGRLAVADPASVPAGKYAQAALVALGAWVGVEGRLAAAENVRAALNFVARGEAPLGIVYATDARAEPRVRVVDTFPAATHVPITYPAAATPSGGPGAAAFIRFLASPAGQAIFRQDGFSAP